MVTDEISKGLWAIPTHASIFRLNPNNSSNPGIFGELIIYLNFNEWIWFAQRLQRKGF
jgi:hypothetical protein